MELLGGFAVLISLGGFIISAVIVIPVLFHGFQHFRNLEKMRSAPYAHDKHKLDRISNYGTEAKERSNGRTSA